MATSDKSRNVGFRTQDEDPTFHKKSGSDSRGGHSEGGREKQGHSRRDDTQRNLGRSGRGYPDKPSQWGKSRPDEMNTQWSDRYDNQGQSGRYRDYYNDGQTQSRNYRWEVDPDKRNQSGRNNQDVLDVRLSKKMSWVLRHGAEKKGLKLSPDGFIHIDAILKLEDFQNFTISDVERVVANNDKKRFHIEVEDDGRKKIRANQGHTLKVEKLDLQEITLDVAETFQNVVHGTYYTLWEKISKQGLCRMGRNHIHMALGIPGQDEVISGMRGTCDVIVYVDICKAIQDGIKFFQSENNVILTAGDENGCLKPKYFKSACNRNSGEELVNKVEKDLDKATEIVGLHTTPSKKKKKKKKEKHTEIPEEGNVKMSIDSAGKTEVPERDEEVLGKKVGSQETNETLTDQTLEVKVQKALEKEVKMEESSSAAKANVDSSKEAAPGKVTVNSSEEVVSENMNVKAPEKAVQEKTTLSSSEKVVEEASNASSSQKESEEKSNESSQEKAGTEKIKESSQEKASEGKVNEISQENAGKTKVNESSSGKVGTQKSDAAVPGKGGKKKSKGSAQEEKVPEKVDKRPPEDNEWTVVKNKKSKSKKKH